MNKLVQNVVGTSKQFQELTETLNKLQSKRELTYQKRDALLASNNQIMLATPKVKDFNLTKKLFGPNTKKEKMPLPGNKAH